MRRIYLAVCILALMVSTISVGATPAQDNDWLVPEEGAVEMFRQGDRAFAVGSRSGGAGNGIVTEKLPPSPGGTPIPNSKCAINSETCNGVCVNYLNYYCKSGDCKGFEFC